jgi:hypothetical protein
MTLEQFTAKCLAVLGYQYAVDEISIEWTVGGMSGGDCYGGSPDSSRESDPEPEFAYFDQLLAHFCPQLTYIGYKEMLPLVMESGIDSSGDYYGNYTDSAYKRVKFSKLYDYLVKQDWMNTDSEPEPEPEPKSDPEPKTSRKRCGMPARARRDRIRRQKQ